ncbi:MAG: glycosyltransferase family 39 protein [Anaerolineales bacterium]|nr:glycosyltransferase family 39 protein [Anaerolineales bacterium]
MPASPPRRWPITLALAALLLAYWVLELRALAVVPRAYEDEPWTASTSWTLATRGVFGTPLQGGLFGSARHYFGFMPLYPVLQAGMFRLAGLGLWQARLTSVFLGLLVLALTFALGRRLFGAPVGLLAVATLLLAHTAGQTIYRPTGILLVDFARFARYDIAVPVFGLSACLALGRAGPPAGRRAAGRAALAGALGGLAGLAHVYGWFWLAALGAALLHFGRRSRSSRWAVQTIGALTLGAGVVLLPYGLYVLRHWSDWLGQVSLYRDRLAPFDPGWYAHNLLTEAQRYGPGLGSDWRGWLRPGLWLMLLAGLPAAVALARQAGRRLPLAAYAWGLWLLPGLLALLVSSKVANYLLLYWPLAALAVAWGLSAAWRLAGVRSWPWLRGLLVVGCAWAAWEGAGLWRQLDQAAAHTTPYAAYTHRLRAAVAAASSVARPSVLGLHTYWFGFSDLPYTSWYYPVVRAGFPPAGAAVPITDTLAALAPQVVLVDVRTRAWLAAGPDGPTVEAWLARDYALTGGVNDATYGRTDVYARRAGDPP